MSAWVKLVTSCADCPLDHEDDRNGRWCAHPGVVQSQRLKQSDDRLPRGCPLRREQLIIAKAPI